MFSTNKTLISVGVSGSQNHRYKLYSSKADPCPSGCVFVCSMKNHACESISTNNDDDDIFGALAMGQPVF